MMNRKRTIATLASMIIGINTIPITSVNAKVIEPEIVKTETWTTSYFIDDDMETLYPYIDCQADIYNDGTVKVSFWNTHEWDGFATVSHTVTLIDSIPVPTDSIIYCYYYKLPFKDLNPIYIDDYDVGPRSLMRGETSPIGQNEYAVALFPMKSLDFGFYSSAYSFNYRTNWIYVDTPSVAYEYNNGAGGDDCDILFGYFTDTMPLSKLHIGREYQNILIYTPTVDPTGTYEFRILGHDITITPELLSGNVVAEPQISETEQKIKELEEENTKLKEENNNLQRVLASYGNRAYGDMNNDGFVDGRDASILLTYYAKTSVGYIGSLNDFIKEQNGE